MLRHRLKTGDLASRSERNAALIRTLSEAFGHSNCSKQEKRVGLLDRMQRICVAIWETVFMHREF